MNRRDLLAGMSITPFFFQNETWDQRFFITETLYEERGFEAFEAIETYVSETFDEAGIDYELEFDYNPIAIKSTSVGCSDTMAEWTDYDFDGDSNVLLTSDRAGGCARVGGNMALAGAENLYDRDHQWVTEGYFGLNIHTVLHEIAHNAGYSHSDRTGRVWGENNVTPATSPMVDPGMSICGHHVPETHAGLRTFHHRYTDCTADFFKKKVGLRPTCEIIECY